MHLVRTFKTVELFKELFFCFHMRDFQLVDGQFRTLKLKGKMSEMNLARSIKARQSFLSKSVKSTKVSI